MSIKVESTTDSETAVTAATGSAVKSETVEKKESASAEKADETADESETSGVKDDENQSKEGSEEQDDSQDDESEADDEKPKKKNGFKKRIDKLNKRASEAERAAEYWRQKALAPQGEQETKQKDVKAESSSDGRPKPDNFESHEDYLEALVDWKADQKIEKSRQESRANQAKTEEQNRLEAHGKRVEAFVKDHSDFDDVVSDVDDIKASLTVTEAILSSENGPELMYQLAKNRKEFERINSLSPIAAAIELGKFEAKFTKSSGAEATKQITKTKAPPPISPIGSKKTTSMKSPDEMSYQEFKKWRESQR